MLYTRISVVHVHVNHSQYSHIIVVHNCNIFAVETVNHKPIRSDTETDMSSRGGIFAGELTKLYYFLC